MNLSVCVQTHPKRAHLIPALLDRLGHAQIVVDPDPQGRPSPLRTYRLALEMTPEGATHRLVVQDDAWPCLNFRERAEVAIAERPDQIVAFYLGGSPAKYARRAQDAYANGERWLNVHLKRTTQDWVNTVALCWPADLARAFSPFAGSRRWASTGDDNVVGAFGRELGLTVAVMLPSLVLHHDVEPSLIGRKASKGKSRFRVAAVPFRDE